MHRFGPYRLRLTTFWRFLLSYLALLGLIIVFSLVTIFLYQDFIETETLSHWQTFLASTIYSIDVRLNEVERSAYQLSTDSRINSFLNMVKMSGVDFYRFRRTWLDIPSYPLSNDFIIDQFIYFKNSGVLMSFLGATYRPREDADVLVNYLNLEYSAWVRQMLEPVSVLKYFAAQPVRIDSQNHSAISLAQSIPGDYVENAKGTVLIVLDSEIIKRPIEEAMPPRGKYLIADSSGTVLMSSFEQDEIKNVFRDGSSQNQILITNRLIDDEKWFVIHMTSAEKGWQYTIGLPEAAVFEKLDAVKRISLFIAIGGLILSVAVAAAAAKRSSAPIRRILRTIPGEPGSGNGKRGLQIIEDAMASLLSDNAQMNRRLDEQYPVLRAQTVSRILRGHFVDEEAILAALDRLNVTIPGNRYVAVVGMLERGYGDISLREASQRLSFFRILVRETIEDILGERALSCDLEDDKVAILVSFHHTDISAIRNELEELLGGIHNALRTRHGLGVVFGCGSIRESLVNTYISSGEANQALDQVITNTSVPFIWYDASLDKVFGYYYPLDLEHRIVRMLLSGQHSGVHELMQILRNQNLDSSPLSRSELKAFFFALLATFRRAYGGLNSKQAGSIDDSSKIIYHITENIALVKNINDAQALFCEFEEKAMEICDAVDREKMSHNDKQIEKLREYLENNFNDINLSLSSVAEQLKLTEAYISNFFKEQTGMNYSAYVEGLRINKAKELLAGAMSIAEVAERSGYASKNTFYKAFKRAEGQSPGTYRDNLK